jgi:hypothetical protein
MNFYFAGYHLIEGITRKEWMAQDLLPDKIYTPSYCICEQHPDYIALPWVTTSEEAHKTYRQRLQLSEEEYLEMQIYVEEAFNKEEYGWFSIFLDLKAAREFARRFLQRIPDIKLMVLGVNGEFRQFLLQECKPKDGQGALGMYLALKSGQVIDIKTGFRGFEVLGWGYSELHSFICNSLERRFVDELNIRLNENGLIDDWQDASRAADYTNDPDTGAEPVVWSPWAIVEIPLYGDLHG